MRKIVTPSPEPAPDLPADPSPLKTRASLPPMTLERFWAGIEEFKKLSPEEKFKAMTGFDLPQRSPSPESPG